MTINEYYLRSDRPNPCIGCHGYDHGVCGDCPNRKEVNIMNAEVKKILDKWAIENPTPPEGMVIISAMRRDMERIVEIYEREAGKKTLRETQKEVFK
jgi:hypothetical protein